MTDEPPIDQPSQDGAASVYAPTDVPIVVNLQYVKDLSFENPRAPQSLTGGTAPEVAVKVDVTADNIGGDSFEVVVHVVASATASDETVFLLELSYAGVFTFQNVSRERMRPLCLVECPRLLFPFVRNVVAEATREGGFPPLLINPIDFGELYRRTAERAAAASGDSAAVASEDSAAAAVDA